MVVIRWVGYLGGREMWTAMIEVPDFFHAFGCGRNWAFLVIVCLQIFLQKIGACDYLHYQILPPI